MSKEKLNKKQKDRILKHQNSIIDNFKIESLNHGLVITHFGEFIELIKTDSNKNILSQEKIRCHLRGKITNIVCGDFVLWQESIDDEGNGVIEALLERDSLLLRPRPYRDPKPVAANIEQIIVVISPVPEPITNLLDRFLIAAKEANIDTYIVINKMDIINDFIKQKKELKEIKSLYVSLGYKVLLYSAHNKNKENKEFLDILKDKTSILVGQSGVGKSSIINSLIEDDKSRVSQISLSNQKGCHTTTSTILHQLNISGQQKKSAIIDSPGIREFGLWHLDQKNIIDGLPEFKEESLKCKFRDCNHEDSYGCALFEAIDTGKISPSRVRSYKHIMSSIKSKGK